MVDKLEIDQIADVQTDFSSTIAALTQLAEQKKKEEELKQGGSPQQEQSVVVPLPDSVKVDRKPESEVPIAAKVITETEHQPRSPVIEKPKVTLPVNGPAHRARSDPFQPRARVQSEAAGPTPLID